MQIMHQNVNGIPYYLNGEEFGSVFSAIDNLFADVSLLVETNLKWRYGEVLLVSQLAADAVFGIT